MKILVLDDTQTRHHWFTQTFRPLGHEVFSAETVQDALRLCTVLQFDLMCLDHDLGTEDTGSTFSSQFLMGERPKPTLVWVHSSNPVGAENIASKWRGEQVHVLVEPFENVHNLSRGDLDQLTTQLVALMAQPGQLGVVAQEGGV